MQDQASGGEEKIYRDTEDKWNNEGKRLFYMEVAK